MAKSFEVLYCNHDLILQHMAESLIFSGFPMSTEIVDLHKQIKLQYVDLRAGDSSSKHFKRCLNLAQAKIGSGHDCFLKGITVSAVVKAPQYFWQQIKRYHFLDIISSQSTMHRITRMNIADCCNEDVSEILITVLNAYIDEYNKTKNKRVFNYIINNIPSGFCLTAGITTNYLQLKTIYKQRKNHKLEEWSIEFMEFLKSLPYFEKLVLY